MLRVHQQDLQGLVKGQLQLSLSVAAYFHTATNRLGKTAAKWNM